MKGNVFSKWLKEFCALVFVQTAQAFILAIIMTLIIVIVTDYRYGSQSNNQIAGVFAMIALASISKMEELIKKIFGIESSITDTSMKGGKGGLLGTYAAIKMAKRAIDNVPKIGKGISGRINAGKEKRQAAIDATNKMNRLNNRYGIGESSNPGSSGGTSNAPALRAAQERLDEVKAEGFEPGDQEYDNALAEFNKFNTSVSNKSASNKINDKYEDKKEKIMEEYNKRISEANKSKRESYKNILSGVTETAGAITGGVFGAAAGGILAAGTGDDILNNVTKGIGMGIGTGDVAGQWVSSVPFAPSDIKKSVSGYVKNLNTYYNKENQKKIKEFEEAMKKFNAGDI